MGATSVAVSGAIRRRRTQAVVLGLVLFLASAAATMALGILDASNQPFERAFAAAKGAHLVIDYGDVAADDLAATTTSSVVTASAGPWPVADVAIQHPNGGWIEGQTIAGRPRPDATIDAVPLSAGHWWERPGEAVIDRELAESLGLQVGDRIAIAPARTSAAGGPRIDGGGAVPVLPGKPAEGGADRDVVAELMIVGIGRSVSTPGTRVWAHPDAVIAASPDAAPDQQMLYRVVPSATEADLALATASIIRGLPAEAIANRSTYLEARTDVNDTADLYVPILLAFSVFALAAAAFTIVNVVSGTVMTRYRDLGVMKAIGFTPRQLLGVLLAQILVPVSVGAALGTALGVAASYPTIERLTRSFGLPGSATVDPRIIVSVPVIGIGVALLAALLPARHAARLSAVDAITSGVAPSRGTGGGRLRRLGLGLPVSLPVRLGLTSAFAHPLRAGMTLGALVVGVAAVTFAVGVDLTLLRLVPRLDRIDASPVRAELVDPSVAPETVTSAISAMTGTARSIAIGTTEVSVSSLGPIPFVGYDGDASWIGYELIRGRWFAGPGEVVAPTPLFRATGLGIGDTLTVTGPSGSIEVLLVGETFEVAQESPENTVLRGVWSDARTVDAAAGIDRWEIQPRAGVEPRAVAEDLFRSVAGVGAYTLDDTTSDEEFILFLSVVTTMGIVLVAISLGGVFDTVLLETRRRTRELAVLKAVGLTPAQVVAMVLSGVVPLGLIAGAIGLPLGLAAQRAVIGYMGEVAGRTAIPDLAYDVLGPVLLAALGLAGLAIAVAGAYLPAQRAAASRIAPVLATE